jgi:phosphatidylserine decarboxylase
VPIPRPLRRPILGLAARVLGMDLSEARDPVTAFGSLDELFVRRLGAGAREWPSRADVAGSPVDGVVGAHGPIEAGELVQAKGRRYTVAELLDDAAGAVRFEGGSFLTLYLAPRHYHRIHAPVGGLVAEACHIPGRLLPVNRPAVGRIDRLFPRNERLVAYIEPHDPGLGPEPPEAELDVGAAASAEPTWADPSSAMAEASAAGWSGGAVAVVAVGAFNVGRITADFDAALVTNRRGADVETHRYEPPVAVDRGEGLMAFHLGSTVVLLFERRVAFAPGVGPGAETRLGQPLTA